MDSAEQCSVESYVRVCVQACVRSCVRASAGSVGADVGGAWLSVPEKCIFGRVAHFSSKHAE